MLGCLEPKLSTYKKNDFITIAGEKFESVGIMLEGEAVVIKENAAGNRVVMDLLKPGDIFGEVVVFAEDAVWPGSVVAQEASKALFIPRQKIIGQCQRMCPWHRMIIRNMLKIVSEKAMLLNKKVEYLTIKSMRGKIAALLLEQYRKTGQTTFVLPLNRNEMADFLNVSRPSMSREMRRMKDEGVIDFHLSSVRIKDIESLKEMVE
jgi:CRP-like cAMP-binding protein